MLFIVVGAIFFVAGVGLAFNIKNAAPRAFDFYAQFRPTVGTATPKTLRIVGGFWTPLGAFLLAVAILR